MSRRLVLDDGRTQRELMIRERITVGRDPGCDVSDGDPRLSRKHAEFLATGDGLVIRDLDSRNGIRVNGRRVQEATLTPGDLIEIAHLAVRFLDDIAADPAGAAQAPAQATPVASVQVKAGFEDDRTRVLPVLSSDLSGPINVDRATLEREIVRSAAERPAMPVRDAGDVAISAMEGTVRVSLHRSLPPRPRLGVQDLMHSAWGWRVLGQGVLLSGVVFLMVTLPMLNWLNAVAGPIGNGLLVRMLAAPLVAAVVVGMIVASLIARTTARGLERHDHS